MSMKSAACVRGVSRVTVVLTPGPGSINRRGAVGVEGLDRLQAPGLAPGPFGLGPSDRAPVRRQYQPGDRVAQLDPVPARLVDVEEERLLDGVLVRSGLDENPVVQADVGGPDDVLARVRRERDMVQAPARSGPVARVHQVVALVGEVQPLRRDRAVVELDLLGDPPAEHIADEVPVRRHVLGQVVDVVHAAGAAPAARVGLGLILQRRLELIGRRVPFGLPVQLHLVPVRVVEQVGGPDARIAVLPGDAQPGRLDRRHPRLQGGLAGGPQPHPADARGLVRGELDRVVLVVVPGAQVHRVTLAAGLGHAEHLHEEPQALAHLGRQQLDVPEVRDLVQRRPRRRRRPGTDLRACHRDLRGKTVPSKSLRAVRTTPERTTRGGWLARSTSVSTSSWPAGCSMLNRVCPGLITARSAPAAPGSSSAVATLTAPRTPIESCTRTGMKVLVQILPPAPGAATSEIFGTEASDTSPSPISSPAASCSARTLRLSSSSASSSATLSYPRLPNAAAGTTTTGMPLSMQVTVTPSMTSVTFPVGSSAPVAEPSVPAKSRTMAAAVPGPPAIAVSPS